MRPGFSGTLLTFSLLLSTPAALDAADATRSGQPVFDRVVELVDENFYDTAALTRFNTAARAQIDRRPHSISAASPLSCISRGSETWRCDMRCSMRRWAVR